PVCDLIRDPRWGRSEEAYGEDPFHAGKLAVSLIKGLRGNTPGYFMVASELKHFVGYGNEANRMSSSSNFDRRLMHEYYARPFESALLEGEAQAYMTAYNAVNGVHCIYNTELKRITREIWKWDGAVCSDNYDLEMSPGYSTMAQKAAAAIKNATIGSFDDPKLGNALEDAFKQGLITVKDIDAPIRNTMRVRIRLGDLDPPEKNPFRNITGTPWTSDSAKALARLVTQKSIVLLKNTDGVLPLDKNSIKSIAIIGNMADSVVRDWYGGYPPYKISSRKGISDKAGSGITIRYAANNNNSAAVNAARSSDVAIVFAGNHPTCAAGWDVCNQASNGKEGIDRKKLNLEADQDSLIRQVYRANTKTILVLICNFPYTIKWQNDTLPAILHMTHSSQETGSALADVLFGDYNPAGRLNMTWPVSISELPDMMEYNIRNGRTYMYYKTVPLYHFGHGLSYTTFSYDNFTTSTDNFCQGTLNVSVDITNTGNRAGEEVVQMYVKYSGSKISRPVKQLCGFKRTKLITSGETRNVTIPLDLKDIAYWDSTQARWVVEAGSIQILMGGSSADDALKVSKEISVCGGSVEVNRENQGASNQSTSPGHVLALPIVSRHASGISLKLKLNDTYDIAVYNLKGMRIHQQSGIAKSKENKLMTINSHMYGMGIYVVTGRVNGRQFTGRICLK
ncbi:MAG: glycoside hydrolase family 3 C-terminal domain-containing protein, partial [Chitinispirillaceae bacterium]|nr:glycoside hydrolase family 3 C-terminal domain-containing protein [Chitinispirillaceae bacterium]